MLTDLHLDHPESREPPVPSRLGGAQTLLVVQGARRNFLAEGIAIAVYALVLGGLLTYTSKAMEVTPEAPMELVMLPPPPPAVEEAKPPEPEAAKPPEPEPPPPPPQAQLEPKLDEPPPPPPPVAAEPAVAPVAPPPPPKPTVAVKPKAKPTPAAKPRRVATARTDTAPVPRAAVPAGATASAIANQIHSRLARAAANAYPESQKPRSARVGYRVQIDAAGHVTSFSITPSGNPAFDAVAARLGGRIGAVDPPGRSAALSGSITFAYQ